MVWFPLAAVLLRPLPLTETEVAFALDQVMVLDPGAIAVMGDALIDALTDDGAATVTVAVWVTGPPVPWAVRVNVCVPAASPVTF